MHLPRKIRKEKQVMLENSMTRNLGDHAIVIGGSIAGLVTARVLADHFAGVTIIERDHYSDQPEFRKGVPQSRHLHALLEQGQVLLENLFPGLGTELAAAGAHILEMPADALLLSPFGWHRRFRPGLKLLCCSRELLEWTIRCRVAAIGTVRFLEGQDMMGLLANSDRSCVTGVQLRVRDNDAVRNLKELQSTLVVDASGRHSRAPEWLQAMGYSRPEETTINAFLGYASRYYAPPKDFQADWSVLFLQPKPPNIPRGGVLLPLEGNRWLVTLVGAARAYPPTDEAGFLDFARSLRSPLLYQIIKDAQPLSSISGYLRTENHLRHYERLPQWPEQFIILGDAVCAFNPVYGQGMTVATQAALLLDQSLREHKHRYPDGNLSGLSRRFQRQVAKINAPAWLLATGADFSYPTTEGGKRSLFARIMHPYLQRVARVSTLDPEVGRALFDVTNLVSPPITLFRPRILMRVIRGRYLPTLHEPPTTTGMDVPPGDQSEARLLPT
jgi:2-polyprenyl-6-methoxyphenol hydroxylase-like FAD-dependent oxidoreductase